MRIQPLVKYIEERQSIFRKRFELRQKPPWSSDPILSRYHFCNNYRELDRVTLFYISHIGRRPDAVEKPAELVFSTVLFRLFNKPETYLFISASQNGIDTIHGNFWFEDIPLVSPSSWDGAKVIEYLEDNILNDGSGEKYSLIRKAYTISSHHHGVPTHVDIINSILTPLASSLTRRTDQDLLSKILHPTSASQILTTLNSIYGLGGFLAYEVACDLNYSNIWNFDAENLFTNVGPGAKRGLQLLGLPPTEASIEALQKHVNKYLLKHNFPFFRGRLLSLRSIEHILCEFSKYSKMKKYASGGTRAHMRVHRDDDDNVYLSHLNSPPFNSLYARWRELYPAEFV